MMTKKKAELNKVSEMIVQTGELAVIIGKSDRWIRQLTTDGVLKQVSRGKYYLAETIQSYAEHVAGGKEEDNKPRLVDHKTEHERIKTEKAALELAELKGELHRSDDVEMVMNDMLSRFRQKVRAIPSRVAPDIVDEQNLQVIKGKMSSAIDEALFELSNYDPSKFEVDGIDGED